jgi:monovalent cation:H+ antiporter-2, CPA2 family
MPHSISLITTIATSFGLALILGLIAVRLRLPALLGYLIAGVLLGPATPGFVADIELSAQLAEIGVMLLMFGVGLHFSFASLMAVRRIAIPGALVQMAVATALGVALSVLWGWSLGAGIILGLSLSVASTVVLLRSLEQHQLLATVNGQIAVGWLVVEDLAVVLVLVLLPTLAGFAHSQDAAGLGWPLAKAVLLTLAQVSVFVALMLLVGRKLFPWLLWQVAGTGSRELFTLSVIAVAVGVAYGSAHWFGVSFALGAFFAGMVMRESPLSHRAAEESLPLRDAFSVLFFVSVGMLLDPKILIQQPMQVMAVVAIIVLGKSLAAFLIVAAFRYPLNTALTVSAGLAQIGEFSFILAGLGVSLGLLPTEGQSLILAGALISIAINPLIFRMLKPVQQWLLDNSKLARSFERLNDPLAELPATVASHHLDGHVVVAGCGRVGLPICNALREQGIPVVAVEQNRKDVESLRKRNIQAVAGDAAEPVVLVQAHIARASVLIIAISDVSRARKMIEVATILQPKIEILVRTHSEEEAKLFTDEQVGAVFWSEHEVALNMAEYVLRKHPGKPSGEH